MDNKYTTPESTVKQETLRAKKNHPVKKIIRKILKGILYVFKPFYPLYHKVISRLYSKVFINNAYKTWRNTFWMGTRILKCPMDMWVVQEMLFEIKPDIVIETGTRFGGSAKYYADIMNMIGKGKVITIDIEDTGVCPKHDRIEYIISSSTDPELLKTLKSKIKPSDVVLLMLDSDHSKNHVLAELRLLADLVTKGSYVIVEDTENEANVFSPLSPPGPLSAIREFLKDNKHFETDRSKEKYFVSFNLRGFLKRVG